MPEFVTPSPVPESQLEAVEGEGSDDPIVYVIEKLAECPGWPGDNPVPGLLKTIRASELLAHEFVCDAHFVQYAPERWPAVSGGQPCRLNLARFEAEHFEETGPISMVLAAFDVDDPVVHGKGIPFRQEWYESEWPKLIELRRRCPELVVFFTKSGYRIVGKLEAGLFPLTCTDERNKWRDVFYEACREYLRLLTIAADPTKDASRAFRAPRVVRGGVQTVQRVPPLGDVTLSKCWNVPPEIFEIARELATKPQRIVAASTDDDTPAAPELVERARKYLANTPGAVAGQGGHIATFKAALKCRGFGLNTDQVFDLLSADYNPRCEPPWSDAELRHKAQDVARSATPKGFMLETPSSGPALDPWDFAGTEQGDAALFAAKHASTVRYVEAWGQYVGWDGKRWTREGGERLARTAWRENLRDQLKEAAKETDPDRVKRLTDYARKRMTSAAEESTIKLAKAHLHISHKELDADPYLLNLDNGILDLRTMQLGSHDPGKLCTRLAPVAWIPGASCPQWLAFLDWAMCGRQDLVDYLQRFLGLCLSGDASHEVLHVFWGDGSNGKTTVVMVAEGMLGDYATRAPSKLLMAARHEAHPTEIADFAGCRMVTLAETKEDQQIDEQILKLVASKDPTKARRMYEDNWVFLPTHKSILLTNHKPRVLGQDHGVWRRLVLVPYDATITEADKDTKLPERLMSELPGILQWAAAGWIQVQKGGLRPPKPVQEATAVYRTDEDALARFVEAECERGPDHDVKARALCEAFNAWAKSGRSGTLSERALAKRMVALGFVKAERNDANYWVGVRLRQATPWTLPSQVIN